MFRDSSLIGKIGLRHTSSTIMTNSWDMTTLGNGILLFTMMCTDFREKWFTERSYLTVTRVFYGMKYMDKVETRLHLRTETNVIHAITFLISLCAIHRI